jgi:hypothetical protein
MEPKVYVDVGAAFPNQGFALLALFLLSQVI